MISQTTSIWMIGGAVRRWIPMHTNLFMSSVRRWWFHPWMTSSSPLPSRLILLDGVWLWTRREVEGEGGKWNLVESSSKRKEAPKEEETTSQREGDYYLAPTRDGKPMQMPKQESASLDVSKHAYENNTLHGKANIVYEVHCGREEWIVVIDEEVGAWNQTKWSTCEGWEKEQACVKELDERRIVCFLNTPQEYKLLQSHLFQNRLHIPDYNPSIQSTRRHLLVHLHHLNTRDCILVWSRAPLRRITIGHRFHSALVRVWLQHLLWISTPSPTRIRSWKEEDIPEEEPAETSTFPRYSHFPFCLFRT